MSSRKEDYLSKVRASGNRGYACTFIARIPLDNDFEKPVSLRDYERALSYFKENSLYSPCNMLIARKDVLEAYCEWVYPMLIELNDRVGKVEDVYQNRYPGFVSERLLTYFFDVNGDKYRVAYADKSFEKVMLATDHSHEEMISLNLGRMSSQ